MASKSIRKNTKRSKEIINEDENKELEKKLKQSVNEAITSSEINLKSYIDKRFAIIFDALSKNIVSSVEAKYEKIHSSLTLKKLTSNNYQSPTAITTREDIIKAIEIAITPKKIDDFLEKYMIELKELRFEI
jgi:hypothetical protein